MRAFLRWFSLFRELERELAEEAARVVDIQDRLAKLQDQNIRLEKAITSARAEQVLALKAVANVGFHLSGLLPPYPEAYQIPRRDPGAPSGPIPSGRVFPRDIVQQAKRDFHDQLFMVPDSEPEAAS